MSARLQRGRTGVHTVTTIGRSIAIQGELVSHEDLVLEGQVFGSIELPQHSLTIDREAKVRADVRAKSIVVSGKVMGTLAAEERVDIREDAAIVGDITAPVVAMADGARLQGRIDMKRRSIAAVVARYRSDARS